jgi:hypothetical protein
MPGFIQQNIKRPLYRGYTLLTARFRVLPDFFLIGVQKGGSTSFYDYIVQHPNVYRNYKKAPSYFDHNYLQGENWYRSHFPPKWRVNKYDQKILIGDASQDTIFHPLAPERVAKIIPSVKLVVLLRNPVDRAFSHYQHRKRLGHETLSFEEAVRLEPERLAEPTAQLLRGENFNTYHFFGYSYLARGMYAEQLKRWFAHFPREQFLIIRSEDFFTRTEEQYLKLMRFLDLPTILPKSFRNSNPGKYVSMTDEMRTYLQNYFREPNQELYELLGQDLGWDA